MSRKGAASAIFFLALFTLFNSAWAFPPSYTDKVREIPDMTQTEPLLHLPGGGKQFCAPVAVSNSLMLLARQGYTKLVPETPDSKKAQALVAGLLGSKRYMNTNLKNGTGPSSVLAGVARFIRDCGYDFQYLGYQGWRGHQDRYRTGVETPRLEWIKEGLNGKSAVWLNVGWYKHDPVKDVYKRVGGHWVTLVGYGADHMGREVPDMLIIHNPASEGGGIISHEYARAVHIEKGRLQVAPKGQSLDAAGFLKLEGGMPVRDNADCAILDGAIVLRM
jgi:hypothetical protein